MMSARALRQSRCGLLACSNMHEVILTQTADLPRSVHDSLELQLLPPYSSQR
ncbi:hypothetical protein J6590_104450, partial [Homalodisca vitripennis]